jgi:putative ABC transport system permease protein
MVLQGGKKKMFDAIHIRMNPDHLAQQNLSSISKLFAKYNPLYPFEYYFVDQEYQRKFADLQTTLTISSLFGFIAIFIACLGLLGLSTFMIESRTKEISIRKVLGGSVLNIIKMLSWSSLKPILIAIVLFSPLGWLAMNWWLQSFEYRITMNIWTVLVTAVCILCVALLTIIAQTFNAANANPVDSLKSE